VAVALATGSAAASRQDESRDQRSTHKITRHCPSV
jgi:hypothetical protein